MRYRILGLIMMVVFASGLVLADGAMVARATFAAGIQDREPVAPSDVFVNEMSPVFFFTEIMGGDGRTIVHRWKYQGNVMADVSFTIQGPRWRIYSSKVLLPFWVGTWTVDVLENDVILGTWSFDYLGDHT